MKHRPIDLRSQKHTTDKINRYIVCYNTHVVGLSVRWQFRYGL